MVAIYRFANCVARVCKLYNAVMARSRQITKSTDKNDAHAVKNMIQMSGSAPVSIVNKPAAIADKAAPPPMIRIPLNPLAEPARCGRTDKTPAFAFGITSPFPSPTNVIKPKNKLTEPKPAMNKINETPKPAMHTIAPTRIIRFIPNLSE